MAPKKAVVPETPAAKKSAAASPKKSSATPQSSQDEPTIVSQRKSSATKQAQRKTKTADLIDETIFNGLSSGAVLSTLVDQVAVLFTDDPQAVVATCVSIVCRAAGFPMSFEGSQFADASALSVFIDELLTRAPAEVASYPLIDKDAKHRKLQRAFPQFFEQLALTLNSSSQLIEEDGAIEQLVPWIAGLADSKARYFRYSASLAIFSMVRALSQLLCQTDRAIAAAKTKKDTAALTKKRDVISQRHFELFAISIHNRVKDVAPEIRLLAFESLRELFTENPDIYVQNKFVRYLSIALFDKRVDIRIAGADILARLLSAHVDHAPKLRDFLRHFADRFVEMSADADGHVAELAIKIAALIIKLDKDNGEMQTLTEEMIDRVLLSLLDDRHGIRAAAGTLLKVFLRCRVGGADDTETAKMRAETLCSLAASILGSQGVQAERYIVDALWLENNPPALLTDFTLFVNTALNSDDANEAGIALRFVAAVAERLRTKAALTFGPVAKDDYKPTAEIASAAASKKGDKAFDGDALLVRIGREFASQVVDLLEKHNESPAVVAACASILCEIDVTTFAKHKMLARLNGMLAAFRRAVLSDTFSPDFIEPVHKAWKALTVEDYAADITASLDEIAKTIIKQLSAVGGNSKVAGRRSAGGSQRGKTTGNDVALWRRVAWLGGHISLTDHYDAIVAALSQDWNAVVAAEGDATAAQKTVVSIISSLLQCCVNDVCWQLVQTKNEKASGAAATAQHVKGFVGPLFNACEALAGFGIDHHDFCPQGEDGGALWTRGRALCAMADFAALPFYDFTDDEQRRYIAVFREAVIAANGRITADQDNMREETRAASSLPIDNRGLTSLRRDITAWEALVTRMSTGVVRLVAFERFSQPCLASVLSLWTRIPVKAAADMFKGLFYTARLHAVRKHVSAASIEIDTLVAAVQRCLDLGDSADEVDQLTQIGSKLASMHFLASDKHYDAVGTVVQFALEHAASSSDQRILIAATPYCSKLRPADALALIHRNSIPSLDGSTPVFRAFVSALRRAAKLEGGETVPREAASAAAPAAASSSSWSTERRPVRPAAASAAASSQRKRVRNAGADEEDDGLMAEIELRRKTGGAAGSSKPAAPQLVTRRVENADGWRTRGGNDATPTAVAPASTSATAAAPSSRAASRSALTSSQGGPTATQLSSFLPDDEVFISTQEWN